MWQLLSIIDRGESGGVGGIVPDIAWPFPIVIDKLAKQLPVVGRCACGNLEHFVVGCQGTQPWPPVSETKRIIAQGI